MLADTSRLGSLPTSQPHHIGADGHVGAQTFHGTRKEKSLGLHPAPVDAQSLQQLGSQGYVPVAAAFALVNANHHAPTVDVPHLQTA